MGMDQISSINVFKQLPGNANIGGRTTERAVGLIRAADNLIIGGTSLNVYPAAGLVQYFRGENIVVVNRGEIPVRGAVFIDAPIAQLFSMC